MHSKTHGNEAWCHSDITKNWRDEETDWGNGHGSWNSWSEYWGQWRPIQQARNESQEKVQWGSWQVGKIIQKNDGSTWDIAPESFLNDEGANRQRNQIASGEKEEDQRKRKNDWGPKIWTKVVR